MKGRDTFLVAAVVAALLGVTWPFIRPKTESERAIAAIRELGGTVGVDEQSPGRLVVAVSFLGERSLPDAALVHVKGLTQLRRLDLTATPITDAGLVHLGGLT